MPVVPISSTSTQQRSRPALPPLDPTFALIAAAQMHSEGRLVQPADSKGMLADSGFESMSGDTQYMPDGKSIATHDLNGTSPESFIKTNKPNLGDVMKQDGKYWMYTVPDSDTGSRIIQVRPKGKGDPTS